MDLNNSVDIERQTNAKLSVLRILGPTKTLPDSSLTRWLVNAVMHFRIYTVGSCSSYGELNLINKLRLIALNIGKDLDVSSKIIKWSWDQTASPTRCYVRFLLPSAYRREFGCLDSSPSIYKHSLRHIIYRLLWYGLLEHNSVDAGGWMQINTDAQ